MAQDLYEQEKRLVNGNKDPNPVDIDWGKVTLPVVAEDASIAITINNPPTPDYFKFVVATMLNSQFQSELGKGMFMAWANRQWPAYVKRLVAEGGARGLTPEEYFQQLIQKHLQDKGKSTKTNAQKLKVSADSLRRVGLTQEQINLALALDAEDAAAG